MNDFLLRSASKEKNHAISFQAISDWQALKFIDQIELQLETTRPSGTLNQADQFEKKQKTQKFALGWLLCGIDYVIK